MISKEELEEFYIKQNHSIKETKKHFNVSTKKLYKLFKDYAIEKSTELKVERVKNTLVERYGVDCVAHLESATAKRRETNLERYGSVSPFGNKEIQNRIKKNFIEKYGTHPRSTEAVKNKMKQTCLSKYGVDNVSKAVEIKEKISESNKISYSTGKPQLKAQQTNLRKYGVTSAKQVNYSERTREVLSSKENLEKYIMSLPEIYRNKHYIAADLAIHTTNIGPRLKRLDLTHLIQYYPSKSFYEIQTLNLLKTKFEACDVMWQYRDPRYANLENNNPFKCDFYIKSLDLFIEGNFGIQHMGEAFDPLNGKHIEQLHKFENRARELDSNWYRRAIQTWTERDPLKRKVAKENNLNWKEFFTINEVKAWLQTLS